jgi:hypothetical protein
MRFILPILLALSSWACNPAQTCHKAGVCVDCQAACERMVQCHVSFTSSNALFGSEDPQAQCERGCLTTDTMTPERERCILAVDPGNSERCQKQVIGCLGADAGPVFTQ